MTSDKDDQDNLDKDVTLGDTDDFMDDDYIDSDGIDEPLSASSLGGAEDYDQDPADDFGSEDEPEEETESKVKKKSGGMTKVILPMLVLLLAAGAGGFIVMNPSVLNGLTQQQAEMSPPVDTTATLAETPVLPSPEPTSETPVEPPQELAAAEIPPQPSTNINETPAQDIPSNTAAPVSDAETVAIEDIPTEPLLDVKPAGTNENALETATGTSAESAKVEEAAAPAAAVPPETAPVENASAKENSAAATPPEMPTPPTAEASAEAVVTQPTFVPAAPEQPPSDAAPAADSAVPPVMNVQEVNDVKAPDMVPKTLAQQQTAPTPAPTAVGGNASTPITPMPSEDSSAYYDSLSQVPSGAMATSVGPREINPVLEPASKMVIVSKYKSGDSQEALVVSATRALKLKRYDAALEMFDQLYAKNRRDVRILMGRAIAQQNMGLSESAVQSYEEVLALKPDNAEALLNMLGLIRAQYPEVALRRLLDLYAKHPNNPGIAAQIGITNASMGHYEDAMRYLGIASTLEPTNAQHLFNMAIAADRQGESVKAIELYQRALEVDVMYGASRSVPRERIYDRLSVLRRG